MAVDWEEKGEEIHERALGRLLRHRKVDESAVSVTAVSHSKPHKFLISRQSPLKKALVSPKRVS